MMMLQPGADFAGRYEIVRVLSTGGMGVVYEVLHRDTQRRRALKLMLPSLLADDDMRARFAREATVTAPIESEHLVEVFDAGVDAETGSPFLVMELLRGEDLSARLERGERTSPREVLTIFDQLTRAIVRTHEAGIVHRDLKPENIFLTKRDDGSLRIKILDFGIAKLVDRGGKSTRSVGTPIYMAPEQMTGKGVGAEADLYALGQIAFTLLVGQPYFTREAETAENVMALMYAVGAGTAEPASSRGRELGVELPTGFDAWFARATHRDAASRFASSKQQIDALHGVLDAAPDVLPVSSGAVRRQAAFGATEAVTPPPAQPSGEPAPPAAPPDLRSTPMPTRLSTPSAQSGVGVQQAQTTGGPSSRTLGGDAEAPPRSRVGLVVAACVVAAGAIAVAVAVRGGAASTETSSASVSAESVDAAPSGSAAPAVVPGARATTDATAVPTSEPTASASSTPDGPPLATSGPTAVTAPARPPTRPGAPTVVAPPTSAPATAPSATSTPVAPPPGTVYVGPRR